MKKLLFSLLLCTFACESFAQIGFNNFELPSTIKRKKVKHIQRSCSNGELRIAEFDQNGNQILDYSSTYAGPSIPGNFVYLILAYQYDSSGKLIQQYRLHSNSGHIVHRYEKDTSQNQELTYSRSTPRKSRGNSNPFLSIKELTTFEKVVEYSSGDSAQLGKEYLSEIKTFYNGLLQSSISFGERKDTTVQKTLTYYPDGKLKREQEFSDWGFMKRYQASDYRYEGEQISYVQSLRGKNFEALKPFMSSRKIVDAKGRELSEYYFTDRNDVSVMEYDYDMNARLIIKRRSEAKTNDENFSKISDKKTIAEMKYKYNGSGLVVAEVLTDFVTNSVSSETYAYETTYWD